MDRKAARREVERKVAEQAAEWLTALEDAGPEVLAGFAGWVRESPQHLKEFLFMSALDSELARMDPQRRLQIDKILAEQSATVVPLSSAVSGIGATAVIGAGNHSRARQPALRARWWGLAASVAFVALITAAFAWWLTVFGETYETAVGEQRTVELADGSVVHLNSRSRIEINLSDRERAIHLIEGEAMFKVARDARPFRVRTGPSVVEVLGTQFNINRRPSSTTVSVIEGRVKILRLPTNGTTSSFGARGGAPPGSAAASEPVSAVQGVAESSISAAMPTQLSAGEEVRIELDGQIERRNIDPANIAAWRLHRLVFRDNTLEDIAAEFNRYNHSPQIRVEGQQLRARRFTAVFDADDPNSLVEFMRQESGLMFEQRDGELVVRSAP